MRSSRGRRKARTILPQGAHNMRIENLNMPEARARWPQNAIRGSGDYSPFKVFGIYMVFGCGEWRLFGATTKMNDDDKCNLSNVDLLVVECGWWDADERRGGDHILRWMDDTIHGRPLHLTTPRAKR